MAAVQVFWDPSLSPLPAELAGWADGDPESATQFPDRPMAVVLYVLVDGDEANARGIACDIDDMWGEDPGYGGSFTGWAMRV